MKWSRISPYGKRKCCSDGCGMSALWHGEAGGVGSDYCPTCREIIDSGDLLKAAEAVVAFDWSDNDADAVAAIERLREIVNR